ncbi:MULTISPECIES: hypothetical protein [Polymorphospora]|uniref:Uncharacterized protein n=1 Tax=Polymorphospora lycopeni TaxID=3140240 RepID=A0ABV5D2H7_9ACTN
MSAVRIQQVRHEILPLYQHFSLRDWLQEPELSAAHALFRHARESIVATDTSQLLVYCAQAEVVVEVEFQVWDSDPAENGPVRADWDGGQTFLLECPSGEVFIDQPTMPAIELGALGAGPGWYQGRVSWRDRNPYPSQPHESTLTAVPASGSNRERYQIQIWRAEGGLKSM